MWPNGRISVMGGEQAASVLTEVRRDNAQRQGKSGLMMKKRPSKTVYATSTKHKDIPFMPVPGCGTMV
jgi:3-methylcrotonyl-CoA carboxylase beta subunit